MWDTVTPEDLKRLFYKWDIYVCPAGHESVKRKIVYEGLKEPAFCYQFAFVWRAVFLWYDSFSGST